jgi:hypothetical protein
MSFLYRPTPVTSFLSGITDPVISGALRGGQMRGVILGCDYKSGADAVRYTNPSTPWILSSGTMNGFLGQDDGSALPSDFFSGLDASPSFPGAALPPDFYSGAFSAPIIPAGSLYLPPTAPDFANPIPMAPIAAALPDLGFGSPNPIAPVGPQPAISSAGSTKPAIAAAAVSTASPITSLLQSLGLSSRPTISTAIVPKSGLTMLPVQPSWFAQSSILPGTTNSTVLIGALAVVVLFGALAAGRK